MKSTAAEATAPSIVNTEDVRNAIARAKLEWESTADALPHIVCLVDERARVIRVNRAIELWQLGRISEALGRDMHELLHPQGCGLDCSLGRLLRDGWSRLPGEQSVEFETHDARLARTVSVALRPITRQDPEGRPDLPRAVLIVYDVTPLHSARTALEALNEGLEARIEARTVALQEANRDLECEIARRELAEEELRQSRDELALLTQQLIQAQENERRRIARELHDGVGQSLSAIKYSLERAAELQRQERHADAHPLLTRTVERVQDSIGEIRSIAMNLRPSVLDDLGVASALAWLCREFAETYTDVEVITDLAASDTDVPHWLATMVFRCTQELLNNVAKHARARTVVVTLVRERETVILWVQDDGIGLPPVSATGSFGHGNGIKNLRERAEMSRGKLTITSKPGCGTRVQLAWPVGSNPAPQQY